MSWFEKIIIVYLNVRIYFAEEFLTNRTMFHFVVFINNTDDINVLDNLLQLGSRLVTFTEDPLSSFDVKVDIIRIKSTICLIRIHEKNSKCVEKYFAHYPYNLPEIIQKRIAWFILSSLSR